MGTPRIWVHQRHEQPPGPQQVLPQETTVHIHVAYDLNTGEEPPNDVHVDYRESGTLLPAKWINILDADILNVNLNDFEAPLSPKPSRGTYDVRVRWTRKKRDAAGQVTGQDFIGQPSERIGQFFVD